MVTAEVKNNILNFSDSQEVESKSQKVWWS